MESDDNDGISVIDDDKSGQTINRFQKCRLKRKNNEIQTNQQLILARTECNTKTLQLEELQNALSKQAIQLEEASTVNAGLRDHVHKLERTVGVQLTTIGKLKTALKNAARRDESHLVIRDQIINVW